MRRHAIVEIDENARLSEIPNVGMWKTGTLDTNPRTFDLLCTGKVQINSSNNKLKLDVSAAERIPDFFTKNTAGEIVFAEPKSMCTVKMPKGHHGTIIVRLKSVSTEQTLAQDYVCLGVREDGVITDVLYEGKSYRYIDMTDASNVELMPLISMTKLPEYTAAEVGTKVAFSDTNFDFGTVYRVTIDDKQVLEWSGPLEQTSGKRLRDIENNAHWYNESNGVGVGPVKGKGVRLLAVNHDTGKLASSVDGANWEDEGYVNGDVSSGCLTGPVYGNGAWCVVRDAVRYSADETQTWLNSSAIIGESLVFGKGVFMVAASNKKVYISTDANTWEEIGEIPYSENEPVRILCYSDKDDLWISISPFLGRVYTSKDGRGTWMFLSPDEGKGLPSSDERWFSCCYAHGNFYALNWGGNCQIMKSSDGKNWDLVSHVNAKSYCITFYDGRLYAFNSDGIHYYVGTFK